ncbi:hypothetical protein M1771_00270 [Spiroplasma citri]|uniref:Uncharacterized protein n=1 Tax=Spiroplasma citri TaxID=2133 RepID=A0AAX3SZ78_SPICI|nr:hypothetical protein [Spiroplasma citri]WFG96486.1 hypothetical protein M0C40_00260 [Spiroplasma citri]WFH00382.1 hypothetical protein M1771_00270 [Spiroplasma citri]
MQVFESEIVRTGYIKEQAILNGFNAKEIVVNGTDHTHYVADAKPVTIKIIYDQKIGLLLEHKFLVIIRLV